MKFILINESVIRESHALNEGKNLEKTYEKFKHKPNLMIEDDYQRYLDYISLDPTFKTGSTLTGDYGEWILNLFANGNEGNYGDEGIRALLKEFNDKKQLLKEKDINRYKTADELRAVLDDTDYTVDMIKKKAGKGGELIFQHDNWTVWHPTTYEASCELGAGAGWCTATRNDRRQWDNYSKNGELYIFSKNLKPQFQLFVPAKNQVIPEFRARGNVEVNVQEFFDKFKAFGAFFTKEKIYPYMKMVTLKYSEKDEEGMFENYLYHYPEFNDPEHGVRKVLIHDYDGRSCIPLGQLFSLKMCTIKNCPNFEVSAEVFTRYNDEISNIEKVLIDDCATIEDDALIAKSLPKLKWVKLPERFKNDLDRIGLIDERNVKVDWC